MKKLCDDFEHHAAGLPCASLAEWRETTGGRDRRVDAEAETDAAGEAIEFTLRS